MEQLKIDLLRTLYFWSYESLEFNPLSSNSFVDFVNSFGIE